jgi:exodeoxyribonuclease VII small subunit
MEYMVKKKLDYKRLNLELDAILQQLQTGELTIDEAMPAYEQGITIIKLLEDYLQTAENQVEELKAKFAED